LGRPAVVHKFIEDPSAMANISYVGIGEYSVLEIVESEIFYGRDPRTEEQRRQLEAEEAHFFRYHAVVQKIIDSIKIEEVK